MIKVNNPNAYITVEADEEITVFNKYDTQVAKLTGPLNWKGTNNDGNLLDSGLYFLIYSDHVVVSILAREDIS